MVSWRMQALVRILPVSAALEVEAGASQYRGGVRY